MEKTKTMKMKKMITHIYTINNYSLKNKKNYEN